MSDGDDWRSFEEMPDEINVLFIEGLCMVPWFQDKFWTCPPLIGTDVRPFKSMKSYRVWCYDDPFELDEHNLCPDAFGIEACWKEIESGRYHAIVVVDFSNDSKLFDEKLGPHLEKFVQAGGVVAFPSSESILVSSLQKFFGVQWERSDYYRTTWEPCEENRKNLNISFGNGNLARRIINPYSAKGNTLRSVPPHERCFGVGKDSKTWSPVPGFGNKDVSKGPNDDDYDIIVAMHDYGKGVIAYFGDVNAETETLWLVAAFIESRTPKAPIDCFASLSEQEFSQAIKYKENGNHEFGASKYNEAEAHYKSAINVYGTKLGSNGLQRETYVVLHSNLSLVYLKQKLYRKAEEAATQGLNLEWGHNKCSYRRAMARLHISLGTNGGDLKRIREAMKDVLNSDPSDAKNKLFDRIEREKKRLESREGKRFSSGFASAMSGVL